MFSFHCDQINIKLLKKNHEQLRIKFKQINKTFNNLVTWGCGHNDKSNPGRFGCFLFAYLFITFLTYQTRLKEHSQSLLLRAGGCLRLTFDAFPVTESECWLTPPVFSSRCVAHNHYDQTIWYTKAHATLLIVVSPSITFHWWSCFLPDCRHSLYYQTGIEMSVKNTVNRIEPLTNNETDWKECPQIVVARYWATEQVRDPQII